MNPLLLEFSFFPELLDLLAVAHEHDVKSCAVNASINDTTMFLAKPDVDERVQT